MTSYILYFTRWFHRQITAMHVAALRLAVFVAQRKAQAADTLADKASEAAEAAARYADDLADAADDAYRHAEDVLTAADAEALSIGSSL